jgi:hypothetical protein
LTKARVLAIPYEAEAKRLLACIEVDVPSPMTVCYDVVNMSLHHQALWLKEYLTTLRDKLAIAFNNFKNLQKLKFMREFKELVEEMLNEDRYMKVLEALFVISYPEVVQALEQQQKQQDEASKMHT